MEEQLPLGALHFERFPFLTGSGLAAGLFAVIDESEGIPARTDIEADSSPGSTTGMRQIEFALKLSF